MYIVFVPGRVRKRAIRRDGKWRDLSGGVKNRGRSGLESEKTSGVWIKLFTLPFCRSYATNLPFVYFPPFYWPNICNRAKGNLCIPSEAFLWKLDRQLMDDETGAIYLHHYIPQSWREYSLKSQTNFFPYFKFPQ